MGLKVKNNNLLDNLFQYIIKIKDKLHGWSLWFRVIYVVGPYKEFLMRTIPDGLVVPISIPDQHEKTNIPL